MEEGETGMALTRKTTGSKEPNAQLGRGRRIAVWALVVLASVIAVVMVMTLWVNRQVLDNTSWRHASEQVIEDPQVQAALSTYLVNQLYDNVDVSAALAEKLPPQIKSISGTLAGALRQPATNAIEGLLSRPRVQLLFVNASSVAHDKLINVLENKTGHGISTGNGVVTLNLHELVTELAANLGLPGTVIQKLPPDSGVITVMTSDQLGAAQKGVRVLKVISLFILILVLGMYALAIYLARGIRRRTLRNIGWSLAVVGLLILLVRRWVGNSTIDTLTSPQYNDPVRDVWLIGTSTLGQIGRATVVYGLIAALGAVLAGPTRIATKVRQWIAPTLNERQGVAWASLGAVYLLVILWGPTHALRVWWGILLLGALLAVGLAALRRQTLKEFPPGSRPAAVPVPAGNGAPAQAPSSPAQEIAKLSELHAAGRISDAEFERAKALVLG